jgi:hypothetical protein
VAAKVAAKKAAPKAPAVPEVDGSEVSAPNPDVFTWNPKDGSAPITFPRSSNVVKPGHAIGFFLRLNKTVGVGNQISFLMDEAAVPVPVQFRVGELDDAEIIELAEAWTEEIRSPLGES